MPKPGPFIARLVALPSWGCFLLLLAAGCASYAQKVQRVRGAYYSNRMDLAQEQLAAVADHDAINGDVFRLDRAMIELSRGQAREAEQSLRLVRDRFEEREQATVAETTLSYLWDDTHRPYAGDDHEKVLLRAFLALTNLLHDGGDAEAYCLQMVAKQQELIDSGRKPNGENPKERYSRVALAPYLRGVLRESLHNSYDDARRSYELVTHWQPAFHAGQVDLARVTHGHHSAPGNGVLYVFALVGRGPVKEAVREIPTSASLLIAGEIVSAAGKHTLPPNIAPIQVPRIVATANEVRGVAAFINRQHVGDTETITNVTQLALEQQEVNHPHVMARAIARRFLKKGMIYGTKEVVGTQRQSVANVAFDVAGMVWEAAEQPDTRCWGLLPDTIQVLRVELPAGEHELALAGVHARGARHAQAHVARVPIEDSRNTYVLASFPHMQPVGEVLVSSPR